MNNIKQLLIIVLVWATACSEKDDTVKTKILKEISTSVNSIVVDKNNTKWVATADSLFRSTENGYEYIELSVSGNIHNMFYDEI